VVFCILIYGTETHVATTPNISLKTILARDLAADVISRLESAKRAIEVIPITEGQETAALFLSRATIGLNDAIQFLDGAREEFS